MNQKHRKSYEKRETDKRKELGRKGKNGEGEEERERPKERERMKGEREYVNSSKLSNAGSHTHLQ